MGFQAQLGDETNQPMCATSVSATVWHSSYFEQNFSLCILPLRSIVWQCVAPAILSAIRGALLRLRQVAPVVGRRAVQRPTAAVEEARVQSAPLHCTTLASVHPLPTAASAAVLRGCCRSLSGGHGRLNWFVGKTRSYLCHRDTEFSALLGLSL